MVLAILAGQPANAFGQADRRNRNPPGADAEPVAVDGGGQGRQQGVEIQQRLAHAHHHDVTEAFGSGKGQSHFR